MRWKESPAATLKAPPGHEEKILNATFRIGETESMADDGMGETQPEFKTARRSGARSPSVHAGYPP